jgi:hypothetical protein
MASEALLINTRVCQMESGLHTKSASKQVLWVIKVHVISVYSRKLPKYQVFVLGMLIANYSCMFTWKIVLWI